MLNRQHRKLIEEALDSQAGVVLLGPRQVGKTTLAQDIADARDAVYLDMERPADRQVLAEPDLYLDEQVGRLVVIDEVQFLPDLFRVLRGQNRSTAAQRVPDWTISATRLGRQRAAATKR